MWFLVLNVLALSSLVLADHHIDCPEPTNITHGHFHTITAEGHHAIGSVIKYECNSPRWVFEDEHDGIYVCASNGHWKNKARAEVLPVCQLIHCHAPHHIENATLEYLTSRHDFVYHSIIQYHCIDDHIEEKYSDEGIYVCAISGHWENKDLGTTLPHCIPVVCGHAVTHLDSVHETDGAQLVTKHATPWTALLKNASEDFHNGVLISHQWILTSSHIFTDHSPEAIKKDFVVYVGVEDLDDLHASHPHHVEKIFFEEIHDATNSSEYDNDIVLLKLSDSVSYGDHIVPICLPHEELVKVGVEGAVTGWDLDHAKGPHHLSYVVLPVEEKAPCVEHFSSHHHGLFPDDLNDEFCTHGLEKHGQNSERDRGAVFQVEVGHKTYAVGVLAYDAPEVGKGWAVYTDVYHHLDWINNVIEHN
uniref:Haptoglobin n=1 Tax=Leucoraja erinaceus TaxID=7782 RepID=J7FHC4_LEUER|nr:haptoglobin [Leucoraja erinacea]